MKRPLWSGAISFGLVNIPVKLYVASRDRQFHFNLLRKNDLCPIKYQRVCKNTGEEVAYEDIAKGYQYEEGDYVVMEEKDFRQADPKRSQLLEVIEFVDPKEIEAKYWDKPYYIEPEKKSEKAYSLFREALDRTRKAGLTKFVMRAKEHLAVIIPQGNILVLNLLRFQNEIVDPKEINFVRLSKINYPEREVDIAVKLIKELTVSFRPENYQDAYANKIANVIEAKRKGKLHERKEEPVTATEVRDIMARLKESLQQVKGASRERERVRK